ncbi:hypothetical protein F511_41022 [Dorcoceras hygrometricum]|uniref:Uncharacterized protein n=1 Tax=Dorcoceras hygrometricum TaxID=472368 RepID=A0A2Z7CYV3_9LAMI|nr:hypothetical protein F511_41022 [Dorcoceras hygrometricum]
MLRNNGKRPQLLKLMMNQPLPILLNQLPNQQSQMLFMMEYTTDDVDNIIVQVLAETAQIEAVEGDQDEHLAQIPSNASLPSALAPNITQITFGQGIEFREVDVYKASLPQIAASDKGNGILVEDHVQGHPAREIFSLICADIEFLVQLREKNYCRHMREHQLEWTRPSSSSLFEGANIVRGFFIPHNHRSILSKCWIRSKIMVDGSWLILEGVDYWRPITNPVNSRNWEALPQRPYIDDLAPLCVLIEQVEDVDSRAPRSRAIHILWGEICVEVIQFSLLGSILPVGSVNLCRNIVVHSSVVDILEKLPNHFCSIVQHGIDSNNFVGYFSHSDVQSIAEDSTEFSTSLADLQNFLSERIDESQSGQTIDDVQTLRFNEFRKSVLANSAFVTADFMDVKKAVRELNAKVDAVATGLVDVQKDLEATKESISHQLLEFQAQAQANQKILTDQLSELVNYINRGANDKKGEGSSRGPQPPPDDQNRGSGNTGGGGDNVRTTSIVDRLIDADRRR